MANENPHETPDETPHGAWREVVSKALSIVLFILCVVAFALCSFEIFLEFCPLPPNLCDQKLINTAFKQSFNDTSDLPTFIFPCARAGVLNGLIVDRMRNDVNKAVMEWKDATTDPAQPRARFLKAVVRYQAALARYHGPHLQLVEKHVLSLYTAWAGRCLKAAPIHPLKPFPTLICTEKGEENPEGANVTMRHINRIPLLFFFMYGEYSGPVMSMIQKLSSKSHRADSYPVAYLDLMRRKEVTRLLERMSYWNDKKQVEFIHRAETHLMLAMNRMAHCNPFPGDDWLSYLNRSGRVTTGTSCDFTSHSWAAHPKERAADLLSSMDEYNYLLKPWLYLMCAPSFYIFFYPHDRHIHFLWTFIKVLTGAFLLHLYCSSQVDSLENAFVHVICIGLAYLGYWMLASRKNQPEEEEEGEKED